MKPKIFIPLMALGHIAGSMGLSYVGNGIKSIKDPKFIIMSVGTLVAGILFVWHYRKTKNN